MEVRCRGDHGRFAACERSVRFGEGACKNAEAQIKGLLDRIVDASSPTIMTPCETRITKLAREKIRLADRASRIVPPRGRFEDFIELSLEFPAKPWNIYESGGATMKRTVRLLAFPEPLRHARESGYELYKPRLSSRC
jgi:hypothetical protein